MTNQPENLILREQAESINENDASRINNLGNISNNIEELNHYLENPDALPSVDKKYIDGVKQRRDALKQDENSLYSFSIGKIKNIPNSKVILNLVQSADVSIIDKYDRQTNELLQNNVPVTLMTAEEKQQYYDAQSRRDGFVTYLRDNFGINQEVGKKLYEEIARRQEIKLSNNQQAGVESDGLRMQREDQKKIDEEKIEEVRDRLDLPNEENKPEKLYRAYTLNPEDLSVEKFQEIFVPMNVNEKDPTKVNDGNELGVYMSTNENMVKYAYSNGIAYIEDLHIEAPRHNDGRGIVNYIKLPSCGVIVEIDTKNLLIKKPEITPYLQGVYNNGFEGDEWIVDKIMPSNYKVKKLILNIGSSGLDKIEIKVDGSDNQKLKEAIEFIKNKFNQKKQEAILYKKFLESISERERMSNKFYLELKWKKYQEENREVE